MSVNQKGLDCNRRRAQVKTGCWNSECLRWRPTFFFIFSQSTDISPTASKPTRISAVIFFSSRGARERECTSVNVIAAHSASIRERERKSGSWAYTTSVLDADINNLRNDKTRKKINVRQPNGELTREFKQTFRRRVRSFQTQSKPRLTVSLIWWK